MNVIKKWNPVNWFKHEQKEEQKNLPSQVEGYGFGGLNHPLFGLHKEIDRVFDNVFSSLGVQLPYTNGDISSSSYNLIKPKLNIKERKKDYEITIEVPGVSEDDINIELNDGTLIISGEKKYEKEQNDEHYHFVECSYGSFRRILSLPNDADENNINAKFKNGVLTINIARKEVAKTVSNAKRIEIKKAA